MVPLTITVAVLSDTFPQLEGQLRARASMVVRKTVLDGLAYAIAHCPVDTGNLKGSLHPFFDDDLHGGWGTSIDYAPHVNYGTVHMPPNPFMSDSADFVRPSFKAAMAELKA